MSQSVVGLTSRVPQALPAEHGVHWQPLVYSFYSLLWSLIFGMAADLVEQTRFRLLVYPKGSIFSFGYTGSWNHCCKLMSCWLLLLPATTTPRLVLRYCVWGTPKPEPYRLCLLLVMSTPGVVPTNSTTITTSWHACRLCFNMVSTCRVPRALAGKLGVHTKSKPLLHYSSAASYFVEQ